MRKITYFPHMIQMALILLMATTPSTIQADWRDKLQGAMETAKEVGSAAVDTTLSVGGKALDATKKMGESALEKSREATLSSKPNNPEERFQEIWNNSLEKLEEALEQFDKIEKAPESSWFGRDKESERVDFEEILTDLIAILDNNRIGDLRQLVLRHQERIREHQEDIRSYKEKKISAPVSHMVETTRSQYEQKIKKTRQAIVEQRHEINKTKQQMLIELKKIGVHLNKDQLSVLLARIDSDNIIQMATVFDVLKEMTAQLMQLTADSGEDLTAARRYYGMHLMLLESVVFMQSKYMEKINSVYIPGIDRISEETRTLHRDTRRRIRAEGDAQRKRLYKQNLHSQQVTLKAAKLYLKNLQSQRNKVKKAREKALKNRALARNTYRTVRISAEFLTLFKASQNSFQAIINLQVPEIVPFENLEVQKKYEELSALLGRNS